MKDDVKSRIEGLLRLKRRGVLTMRHVADQIFDLTLRPGFFECMELLSEELVAALRENALHAPAHPEDVLMIGSHCGPERSPEEVARSDAQVRLSYYWCARVLREHFYPDLPLPLFDPIVDIGKVAESARIDGCVVLFGEFYFSLIRANPVHCVTPSAECVPIIVLSQQRVKYNHERSPDGSERRWGRRALTLGDGATTPERFPPGTTVWVDRTNVAEIPPLPLAE